jgi:kynurenine formamidase
LVDLTHAFDSTTIYWPTSTKRFEHTQQAFGTTPGGYFYSSYELSTPEHGGTHLDAPIHFGEGKQTVDAIPLSRLVARVVVIDISARAGGCVAHREFHRRWEHGPDDRADAVPVRALDAHLHHG